MDEQKIERELKSFFADEVKEVEPPLQWWANAVSQATALVRVSTSWEHITGMFSKPILRVALPVALVLVVIGTLWGMGYCPDFKLTRLLPSPQPQFLRQLPKQLHHL